MHPKSVALCTKAFSFKNIFIKKLLEVFYVDAEKFFITTIINWSRVKNAYNNMAPKKDFVTSRKSVI